MRREIWWVWSVLEIKKRFARSSLGPFWITLSMALFVTVLSAVFSQIFGQKLESFVPHVGIGIIFWIFYQSVISEGTLSLINSRASIHNIPLPLCTYFIRVVAINILILLHNIVIYLVIFVFFIQEINLNFLYFIPGFMIFVLNVCAIGFLCAIISARYRDVPQLINSVLQLLFLVTPIFWSVNAMPTRAVFVEYNPLYHLMNVVRLPLQGQAPELMSWYFVTGGSLVLMLVMLLAYKITYKKIAYWV